jgi:hypothetical protein
VALRGSHSVLTILCEAIGLKADQDYINLYSGDKDTLVESLEYVQRASAAIFAAIIPPQ